MLHLWFLVSIVSAACGARLSSGEACASHHPNKDVLDVDSVESPGDTPESTEAGHFVELPVDALYAEQAAREVSEILKASCAEFKSSKVLSAASQVELGVRVWLQLELAPGAVHNVEVQLKPGYWVDSSQKEIDWPQAAKENPCDLLDPASSILPANVTSSLMQQQIPMLSPEQSDGVRKALHAAVPPASLAQMDRLSQLNPPSDYDVRTSRNGHACFHSSVVKSQGACGSCWAFAALGALGDRHCMSNPALLTRSGQRLTLSVQQLLSCVEREGCDGGHAHFAYDPMIYNGVKMAVTDEYPYAARCFDDRGGVVQRWGGGMDCGRYRHLTDEDDEKPCHCVSRRVNVQPHCDKAKTRQGLFTIEEYYALPPPGQRKDMWSVGFWSNREVERNIMAEVSNSGPAFIAFETYEDFHVELDRRPRAVYRRTYGRQIGGHAAVLVGYGSQSGTPYWYIRNSWGLNWGEQGHWKHIRGSNDCDIESGIVVPAIRPIEAPEADFGPERNQFFKIMDPEVMNFVQKGVVQEPNIVEHVVGAVTGEAPLKRYGQNRTIWELHVTCSSPCEATNAVMLNLYPRSQEPWSGKCCCDDRHYTPVKCSWISESELPRDWFLQPTCGVHDLGRGRTNTFDGGDKLCDRQLWDSRSREGTFLRFQNIDETRLYAEIDLTEHPGAKGRVQVRLQAQQIPLRHFHHWHGLPKAEQIYDVEIYKYRSSGSATDADGRPGKATEVFDLIDVETKFQYKSEPYKVDSDGVKLWKVKQVPQVQLLVHCSLPCRPAASFRDLDPTHHPNSDVVFFDVGKSLDGDDTIKILSANLEEYPAGEHTVLVQVFPLDSREHSHPHREITVNIPWVSETQGKQWDAPPFATPMFTTSAWQAADGSQRQMVKATCNMPCEISTITISSAATTLEEGESENDQVSEVTYIWSKKKKAFPKRKFAVITMISTTDMKQYDYRVSIVEGSDEISLMPDS